MAHELSAGLQFPLGRLAAPHVLAIVMDNHTRPYPLHVIARVLANASDRSGASTYSNSDVIDFVSIRYFKRTPVSSSISDRPLSST